MILKRLSIRDFRQFREAEIEFERGLTAIVGSNGSGKTTIIEAIGWALYGEQRQTKETLRRIGAEGKSSTSVSLTFLIGDQEWRVERSLTNASLVLLGAEKQVRATSLREVTQEVTRLLGLTYEQFKNSFCTEQKDLTFLKFRTAGRQQEELARMLGFDRIRAAAKVAKDQAKAAADQAKGMEEGVEAQSGIVAALESARNDAKAATDRHQAAIKKLEDATKASEGASERLEHAREASTLIVRIKEREALIANLTQQVKAATDHVEKRRASVNRRRELLADASRYVSLHSRHQELVSLQQKSMERTKIGAAIDAKRKRAEQVAEEIGKLRKEVDDETHQDIVREASEASEAERALLKEWNDRRQSAESELAKAIAEADVMQAQLVKLEEFKKNGTCPTCGMDWTEDKSGVIADARNKATRAQQNVDEKRRLLESVSNDKGDAIEAEKRFAIAKQALDNANATLRRASDLKRELDSLLMEIADEEASLSELPEPPNPTEIEATQKEMDSLHGAYIEYASLEGADDELIAAELALQGARSAFAEAQEELTTFEQRLEELGYKSGDSELVAQATAEAEGLIAALTEVRAFEKQAQEMLDLQQKHLNELEEAAADVKAKKKLIQNLKSEARLYHEVSSALTDLREALNQRTRPLLEQLASNNLTTLSGGRYIALKLSDRYEAKVLDDSVEKDVISGGEEDIVALSLRLALAQLIQERSGQPMSLLLLDEVFGSLDAERRSNVITQLNAMRDLFDQIIVISHIDSINDAADRCLSVRYDPIARESTVSEAVADDLFPVA
ncbi:MAG: SMC family ATPase [Fimbriimonadales bacterium]|nr:SMC family ATPase [Fimbriimonadales bacterium]